jgi:hypothetical protein
MTVATATMSATRSNDFTELPLGILLVQLLLILAWVGATVIWGLAGLVIGAEVATALAFVTVLALTRAR